MLPLARLSALSLACLALLLAWPGHADPAPVTGIEWDRATLRLVQEGGGYGRIARLYNERILCAYERAGRCWVRESADDAATWSEEHLAAVYPYGAAANPELLPLRDGRVLLLYNERPSDHIHPFAIRTCVSRDNGKTWQPQALVYAADADPRNGCWEPAAIQLPSGEIQLFFANENPYRESDEQEIAMCRSRNGGRTWSRPITVSFRARKRDGMPVPIVLAGNRGIAIAIEDNGLPTNMLQPAILHTRTPAWPNAPIMASSPDRWWAAEPPLPDRVYAGAPYLRQLPTGETLLSYQTNEPGGRPEMAVRIGDSGARGFGSPSYPFAAQSAAGQWWNSLFVKDANTVVAVSGTSIDGKAGVWLIEGRVVRAAAPIR